jgi:hypothetical protein
LAFFFVVVISDTVSFSLPATAGEHYFLISTFQQLLESVIFQFQPSSNCWRALFFNFNLPATAERFYFCNLPQNIGILTFPYFKCGILFIFLVLI